jgi:hypothetical protein
MIACFGRGHIIDDNEDELQLRRIPAILLPLRARLLLDSLLQFVTAHDFSLLVKQDFSN